MNLGSTVEGGVKYPVILSCCAPDRVHFVSLTVDCPTRDGCMGLVCPGTAYAATGTLHVHDEENLSHLPLFGSSANSEYLMIVYCVEKKRIRVIE